MLGKASISNPLGGSAKVGIPAHEGELAVGQGLLPRLGERDEGAARPS